MNEKKGMTEDELLTAVDSEVSAALGESHDRLSSQRADAMKYYLGEPYGNEEPDRSSVVTREVMDTIEWVKPELMKLFASGGDTVRFEPQGPGDVEQSEQETDYVNYLFHRKNPGFKILYEWINDGLLQKTGIVKAWFDSNKTKVREEYAGLTQTELIALAARDDIEVIEQSSYDSPQALETLQLQQGQLQEAFKSAQDPQMQQQIQQQAQMAQSQPIPQLYDVAVLREGAQSGLAIENVPPEEFLISRKAKCIQGSPFCGHRREMTISEIREMGYDIDKDVSGGGDSAIYDEVRRARHDYDDTHPDDVSSTEADESMRTVWATEAYIRCDYDGDGVAELRKVFKVGREILENVEVDAMPFAGWTPIIISHKFTGLSMADLVSDLQKIQSQLFRNLLDNQYLANNGRYVAVENMVNLDDLLTSRPHGVIRAKMVGAVSRLDTPQLGPSAFQMLGYVDQLRERRTGVSERTQGLDPTQLGANTAATAVNQVMTAAQQRIELVARVFAETGLTDLFRLIHKLVCQNQTNRDIFRLRDQYIEVDPSTWRERMDTAVVVGLGNGSREQEMLQLNMIFQNQLQLMSNPATAGIVLPKNIYNTLEDQVKVFNKAASGRHFTDPTSPEGQQVAQSNQQMQMQEMQKQEAKEQAVFGLEQAKQQTSQFKAQSDAQHKQSSIVIDQQAQALDEREHEDDVALRTAELAAEIELESTQERGVDLG